MFFPEASIPEPPNYQKMGSGGPLWVSHIAGPWGARDLGWLSVLFIWGRALLGVMVGDLRLLCHATELPRPRLKAGVPASSAMDQPVFGPLRALQGLLFGYLGGQGF